jgi:hypothetical protein
MQASGRSTGPLTSLFAAQSCARAKGHAFCGVEVRHPREQPLRESEAPRGPCRRESEAPRGPSRRESSASPTTRSSGMKGQLHGKPLILERSTWPSISLRWQSPASTRSVCSRMHRPGAPLSLFILAWKDPSHACFLTLKNHSASGHQFGPKKRSTVHSSCRSIPQNQQNGTVPPGLHARGGHQGASCGPHVIAHPHDVPGRGSKRRRR